MAHKAYGLNELREMYLKFFESKGHLRLPSFSLVPQNDKSILLINAGMTPMKPWFTGEEEPPRSRVTTCQKCIRTGDIENVGHTARHGTYFEMLGNFSFGDYFKKEAIPWAWEFLTSPEWVGLEPDRLYPSVFEGNETTPADDEAFARAELLELLDRMALPPDVRVSAASDGIEALEQAEVIVLAPGSLYTSIIPNLLVDGIVDAIRRSRALKVYVCNVMTQDGETEGYTVSDHIRALFKHSCPGLFDLCLTNSSPIPPAVVQRYALEGAEPIFCDREAVEALGVEIISRPVATVENGLVRHNPGHLAWELVQLHNQRNIRLVCRDSHRTTCNRVET